MATQQQQQMEVQEEEPPQLISKIAKSFNCLIPMLIGVLQVNSQSTDESPFKTHPTNMWVFVFSTFIYYSVAQGSVSMAVISGSLSSVSLLSVLLPRLLEHLIFIAWAFVTIIVAYQVHALLIHSACQRLHQMTIDIISKCHCQWFTPSNSVEQQRRPPV
ncbi:hypothetical protein EZV62_009627 [Acer yangbiense]|uniref:Uncharacterized protein n=1 Tax=Acer yangbiense TaxID=1000413 RepID=A0A5C7HZJ0_9ROSI|nr:hypothetical protein EZV62_009627 [Acer yangbiense]